MQKQQKKWLSKNRMGKFFTFHKNSKGLQNSQNRSMKTESHDCGPRTEHLNGSIKKNE